MGRFYTDEDVARWEKPGRQSIDLHLEKLATSLPEQKTDFHMGMLALCYEEEGMICVAKGKFQESIQAFTSSVETKCKQYERFDEGTGRALGAGTFQSILIAFATKDHDLVARIAHHYRAENGTPDSIFLGRALKLLVMEDLSAAKDSLKQKRPRLDSQFVGYPECLEAIANKDELAFADGLEIASTSWAKVVSKRDRGLPYSVCFIQGVGLIRLAEKTIGRRISIADRYIPSELLE